jgi:predicted metalloprotease with PDZ domain
MLGAMIDLIVRDATNGRRSIDDVMRAMLERFAGARGFTNADVERTVADVCGCPMRSFFDTYVRSAGTIDFNRYLALIGLRAVVTSRPALGPDSQPAPDRRIYAWLPPGERTLSLLLTDPSSVWVRAGLHTGDRLVAVNGSSVTTYPELRAAIARARIGDTVRVDVRRPAGAWQADVVVAGYERPTVRVEELAGTTEPQRALRTRWSTGSP